MAVECGISSDATVVVLQKEAGELVSGGQSDVARDAIGCRQRGPRLLWNWKFQT